MDGIVLTDKFQNKLSSRDDCRLRKNAFVGADWLGVGVSIILCFLKHMLPIRFEILVTRIIPDRCACLCSFNMRTCNYSSCACVVVVDCF